MDEVGDWCIKAIYCVVDPNIGMVAKRHHSRTNALALTFEEGGQFVAQPAGLFDTFAAMVGASKSVPCVAA